MNEEIRRRLARADRQGWKSLSMEFGEGHLDLRVPPRCEILRMKPMPPIARSRDEILRALRNPIGCPPLGEIIRAKGKAASETTVCVTVSDVTRPVPYKGDSGVLPALLQIVEEAGVRREHIVILIGNGMHRPSTREEREAMYGADIAARYRIEDHDCENLASQVLAARTTKGTEVYVNRIFFESDVKITTGLVESHFMAGFSGGRKAVCPALVNTKTIQKFHGVDFLEHPNATNLVLDGNPCHEEAMEVARSVGVDFIVNTTLDNRLRITGVFAGDLIRAHEAACAAMRAYVRIPVDTPFDIVLTHAGYVGRDHYQSVKAAVCALPALREGGILVLAANTVDVEPIGSPEYRSLLHLFKLQGPDRYIDILRHPRWLFTKDQWEPEMWGKAFRHVGEDGLFFCSPQITERDYRIVPGVGGCAFLPDGAVFPSLREKAQTMVDNAVACAVHHPRFDGKTPSMAFIEEGPYAIPLRVTRAGSGSA